MNTLFLAATDLATSHTALDSAKRISELTDRAVLFLLMGLWLAVSWVMLKAFRNDIQKKDEKLEALTSRCVDQMHATERAIENNTKTLEGNTQVIHALKAKLQLSLAVLMGTAVALTGTGCAKFSGYTLREYKDGPLVSEKVHFRGFTLMDGKAKLADAKAGVTKTTASIGVAASEQESSGESVVQAIEKLPSGIADALKKAVRP